MRKLGKWLLRVLAFLLILFIIIVIAAYFYIRPGEPIGWPPKVEVTLMERLEQMVHNRSLRLQLKEDEINALGAEFMETTEPYRTYKQQWNITGMRMRLDNDAMNIDVQAEAFAGVQAGVRVSYKLEWNESTQTIRAIPEGTHVKALTVPQSWLKLKPLEFPLASQLPAWVKIKHVEFTADGWWLTLGLKL
ncbi:hypothetical protein LQV63_21935 [Paenibacillus profundus]|uniref:DUF2140 family protein n=1 Tax=Paenibacillus profundus TaxID=1173085 RepID=A0ABS8YNN8_9BACL|nr:hypothetical protein [Paenibacillus profundus]MCE5171945.1 hypothetical protein [Paenibacillus profundus]